MLEYWVQYNSDGIVKVEHVLPIVITIKSIKRLWRIDDFLFLPWNLSVNLKILWFSLIVHVTWML